jgi:hypothetical protein
MFAKLVRQAIARSSIAPVAAPAIFLVTAPPIRAFISHAK